MSKDKQRPRIVFSAEKLNNNRRFMYLDTVREALQYLLEHEMPQELVEVCEAQGWIENGAWCFSGMCKSDVTQIYCAIKNILNNAKNND